MRVGWARYFLRGGGSVSGRELITRWRALLSHHTHFFPPQKCPASLPGRQAGDRGGDQRKDRKAYRRPAQCTRQAAREGTRCA